jgi:hypothetical protein
MSSLGDARNELHRIAVHVVARTRIEATGRLSLRVTPGGFGTPDLGSDGRRIRVSGGHLVVESDAEGAASVRSTAIHGASLAQLAAFAGVDLTETIDVGHDTPPLGDVGVPITLDGAAAAEVTAWFADTAAVLDAVVASLSPLAAPTLPRLWPEHFDVAIEAQATAERRVNLGGSPGDVRRDAHPQPARRRPGGPRRRRNRLPPRRLPTPPLSPALGAPRALRIGWQRAAATVHDLVMEIVTTIQSLDDLERVLDRVIATAEPVVIVHRGQRLRIVVDDRPSRLTKLVRRDDVVVADPEALVHLEWVRSIDGSENP